MVTRDGANRSVGRIMGVEPTLVQGTSHAYCALIPSLLTLFIPGSLLRGRRFITGVGLATSMSCDVAGDIEVSSQAFPVRIHF